MSGRVYMSRGQAKGVFSVASQVNDRLQRMNEEMLPLILELIHAQKSSSDRISSATYQKLLSGQRIASTASDGKYEVRLSLELSKQP